MNETYACSLILSLAWCSSYCKSCSWILLACMAFIFLVLLFKYHEKVMHFMNSEWNLGCDRGDWYFKIVLHSMLEQNQNTIETCASSFIVSFLWCGSFQKRKGKRWRRGRILGYCWLSGIYIVPISFQTQWWHVMNSEWHLCFVPWLLVMFCLNAVQKKREKTTTTNILGYCWLNGYISTIPFETQWKVTFVI